MRPIILAAVFATAAMILGGCSTSPSNDPKYGNAADYAAYGRSYPDSYMTSCDPSFDPGCQYQGQMMYGQSYSQQTYQQRTYQQQPHSGFSFGAGSSSFGSSFGGSSFGTSLGGGRGSVLGP